jgi:PncC family amidohydrolase
MLEISELAKEVCRMLSDGEQKLAVAESCTGGLLCSVLTSVPKCGSVLEQGFITYTKDAKVHSLGIDRSLLERHGVISPECATAMAEGARAQSKVDFGIGITGVAGPDTAEDQPVGLVYLACATVTETVVMRFNFGELERDTIRELSAYSALDLLKRILNGQ